MGKILGKTLVASLLCLQLALPAGAQFYSLGEDPGPLKWSRVSTANYRIIYPEGYDSLARVYARLMEQVRIPVGGSLGYVPNESYRKPFPVILHPYSCTSNGTVVWAPRRTEFYTTPDPSDPDPLTWPVQLSIHESRHIAQMQPYASCPFAGKILTGDLVPSVLAAVCGGPSGMEGDAVVAETSLTASGRGRTADFLEYIRACFAEGDMRDYWQWRFGSQKKYTPDYYKIGYMSAAGLRQIYGFDKWPYHALSKALPRSFPTIAGTFAQQWEEQALSRGPFMNSEKVSATERLFKEYSSLVSTPDGMYALKEGLDEVPHIVILSPDGGSRKVRSASYSSSRLKYNSADGKLYWTETVRDARWALRSYSIIRRMDPKGGKAEDLTEKTRYFNVSVSADGSLLAASHYREDGSCAIAVLDSQTGKELQSFPTPDDVQPVETAWVGNEIYVSTVDEGGMGIRRANDFTPLFASQFSKIKELGSNGGKLTFVSDRNGVDELYSYDPKTGKMLQLTSSRQGSTNHAFVGDTLYYTSLSSADRGVYRTAIAELKAAEVEPRQLCTYPLAEYLSGKEPFKIDLTDSVEVSAPEHYSRLKHSFRFHSWLPVYVNPDIIESLSFSTIHQDCGLGATAFFQNELSTLIGSLAFSAWTPASGFAPQLQGKMTYGGLYPKFEFSGNLSSTSATTTYILYDEQEGNFKGITNASNQPSVSGSVRVYLPLASSKGGWSRGLIPQAKLSASNSTSVYDNKGAYHTSLSAGLRAYMIQNTPSSCLYPRWGIGAEAGYATTPGLTHLYISNLYGFVYGYVPGFVRTHGIKLSALAETLTGAGPLVSPYANAAPRGCTELKNELSRYKHHGKFTFDYALPFGAIDWSGICPVAYIRNFELIAHYDLAWYSSSKVSGTVSSAGADIVAKLGNLLWLPYTTRIGLSYNRNFGDLETSPNHFSLVFSVDF